MYHTIPRVSTCCVVFTKVHRSVQGYGRPDEWDSDGAVQKVAQFAGHKVNVRKKLKRKEKNKVGVKKRSNLILHVLEHRCSAGWHESLGTKWRLTVFSGRTWGDVMRRCAAQTHIPVRCRCLLGATRAAFTATLSALTGHRLGQIQLTHIAYLVLLINGKGYSLMKRHELDVLL